MRVKLIIGWLYAVILCLIYGFLLSAYGFLLRFPDPFAAHESSSVLLLFFLTLFVVFIGCCFGVFRFCRKHNLDSRGHWRFALLVLLTIPVACLMRDASPIEHDYSLQDIVPGDQKILESYDTLMLFRTKGWMNFNTTSGYYQLLTNNYANLLTNALAYSESISHAWDSIAAARSIIEKLDTYPGIADLIPQVQLGTNTPILDFYALGSIGRIYGAYASLKTAEGHPEEVLQQLAKLQSVAKKALPHSALIIDKMMWIAMIRNNIAAAYAIMQQSQCSQETLEILQDSFPSISEDDVSLRRVFIGQYMWRKTFWSTELRPSTFLDAFVITRYGEPPKAPSFFHKVTSCLAYHLTFRKNRTFRDMRAHCDLLVEGAGKHPPDMSQADRFMDDYGRHPVIHNLGGWRLVSFAVPSYMHCSETAVRTKVLSDLLAIEIGNRLDHPVVLNDYYSGGPYGCDARSGRVFSVGPDKKPNTDDDIVLGKN